MGSNIEQRIVSVRKEGPGMTSLEQRHQPLTSFVAQIRCCNG
jgi:hypothetical protein